jgi:hypothetical protein
MRELLGVLRHETLVAALAEVSHAMSLVFGARNVELDDLRQCGDLARRHRDRVPSAGAYECAE